MPMGICEGSLDGFGGVEDGFTFDTTLLLILSAYSIASEEGLATEGTICGEELYERERQVPSAGSCLSR